MTLVPLTERTVTYQWNKAEQRQDEIVKDSRVYVNPDAIECFRAATDGGLRYASHLRMRSAWDLFVTETVDLILARIASYQGQP